MITLIDDTEEVIDFISSLDDSAKILKILDKDTKEKDAYLYFETLENNTHYLLFKFSLEDDPGLALISSTDKEELIQIVESAVSATGLDSNIVENLVSMMRL